ncbi:alanyl-tRNA editing protein [Alicyclobacillus dauci]|uniref:Alanyl-tRNA editing protein n=1 Tax=Alicyclobacillus dauci TaxID=1475485 RepID=A0ABY6Z4S6_9BACL|nr:alanyl-tRNA editing protein [Alicyclobacillus dauci]WAH37845.1 alanyl-tRNA editing protein [Alicyclobacillus dauci]
MDVTSRLYYFDSDLQVFEATVVDQRRQPDDRWGVVLSQTAFYPTSGGQPHDLGTINGMEVIDVFVDGEDVVHVLREPLAKGTPVEGRIDWTRRFDHMQQHCGQHILSAAFEQTFDWDTVGFHMGDEWSTLDLDTPSMTTEQLSEAEQLANQIIWDDLPVTAQFVDPALIPSLSLRHAPKVNENIRIVTIQGFDNNACGGTHPKRTGQVGMIKVLKAEKMRSGTRLTFVCGGRALRDYEERNHVIQYVTNQLSASFRDIPEALTRMQQSLLDTKRAMHAKQVELYQYKAQEAVSEQEQAISRDGFLVVNLDNCGDPSEMKEMLKAVKRQLEATSANASVFIVAQVGDRIHVQGDSPGLADVQSVLRPILEEAGGKGGGNAKIAQGAAPATEAYGVNWYVDRLTTALQAKD